MNESHEDLTWEFHLLKVWDESKSSKSPHCDRPPSKLIELLFWRPIDLFDSLQAHEQWLDLVDRRENELALLLQSPQVQDDRAWLWCLCIPFVFFILLLSLKIMTVASTISVMIQSASVFMYHMRLDGSTDNLSQFWTWSLCVWRNLVRD